MYFTETEVGFQLNQVMKHHSFKGSYGKKNIPQTEGDS